MKFTEAQLESAIIERSRTHATDFLQAVLKEAFAPSIPEAEIVMNKGYGVARTIPVFCIEDYIVYYFRIKELEEVVDDKAKYTDWSARADIKAELKVDLIILLAKNGYPPVDRVEVYKEIFEQAENFKKYQKT